MVAATVLLCGPSARSAYAQTTLQQTLVVGDSITADWGGAPVRYGVQGGQACTIRLHLPTIIAYHPSIHRLLIEAGTDDVIQTPGGGLDCDLPIQDGVTSVVDMVKTAKAANMQVFVLSVLPISWNNRAGQPCDPLVPPFNASLQAAITAAGAYWVDAYDSFNGHPELQSDGVHPTPAGYQLIDSIFTSAVCSDTGDC